MKRLRKAILAGAVILAPMASFAGIDGTHHDMTTLIPAKAQKCAYCHSLTNVAVSNGNFGQVGGFCVSVCHQSGSDAQLRSAATDPQGPGVFSFTQGNRYLGVTITGGASTSAILSFAGTGHASNPTNLTSAGDLPTNVAATGWPHSSEANIQCTTCHAVHDGQNPPFLNGPLSTGNATTAFCTKCHKGDSATYSGTAGRLGASAHVTESLYPVANTTKRSFFLTNALNAPPNMFVVANGTVMNGWTTHWNTGGHLMSNALGGLPVNIGNATPGFVGCYSCHAVHNDATTPSGAHGVTLTLANQLRDLCYACHGNGQYTYNSAGAVQENPGMTNGYHPVNIENAASYFHLTGTLTNSMKNAYLQLPSYYRNTNVANSSPYCVSCHAVHGSRNTIVSNSLRIINVNIVNNICSECHGAIQGHHPSETATNYTATTAGNFAQYPAWGGNSNLADGLQCYDCHQKTAHNW